MASSLHPLKSIDAVTGLVKELRKRILFEITPQRQVHCHEIDGDGKFEKWLEQGRFDPQNWLLSNRIPRAPEMNERSEEHAFSFGQEHDAADLVHNGYENMYLEAGLKIGVISPFGLAIALREAGGHSENYVRDRELTDQWAKLCQVPQLAPKFPNDGYGIWQARSLITDHLSGADVSFTVRTPECRWDKENHKSRSDFSIRLWMFTWPDLSRLLAKRNAEFIDFFTPEFDWNEFWQSNSEAAPLPQNASAQAPQHRRIDLPMDEHDGVYYALKEAARINNKGGKVLVLNFDAHHDRQYERGEKIMDVHCGNWARAAEQRGLARVVHLPSYYDDDGGKHTNRSQINWNTAARRSSIQREIQAIFAGEPITEVWLTIDFDAASLKTQSNYEDGIWWDPVYHYEPAEFEANLRDLSEFLTSCGIRPHRVLPCSSALYLNIKGAEGTERALLGSKILAEYEKVGTDGTTKAAYIHQIRSAINRVF